MIIKHCFDVFSVLSMLLAEEQCVYKIRDDQIFWKSCKFTGFLL